jgi:hypothetical protein
MKELTLAENVEVSSVLTAANNPEALLRRVVLLAPEVNVYAAADGTIGRVLIPSAGRLLYEDHQTNPAATQPKGAFNVGSGAIAIGWSKSMTYDAAANRVVLDSTPPERVAVARQQPGQEVVSVRADRLVADLLSGKGAEQNRLKAVHAEGNVTMTTKGTKVDAAHATYSPDANQLTVRGENGRPVELEDGGLSKGSFEELVWDLKANQLLRAKNLSGSIRR